MQNLPLRRILSITAFAFSLTMVANTLDPAVYGHKILELSPDKPNTALGLTLFAGSLLAMFVQPLMGALSDRTYTRWGKRMPYLAGGTVLTVLTLYLMVAAPSLAIFVGGVLVYQFANNIIFSPWQALFPDHVPLGQRGRASGLKAFLDILGLLVGRAAAGQLVGRFASWGPVAIYAAITLPAIGLISSLLITWVGARPHNPTHTKPTHKPWSQVLAQTFRVDFKAHPAFGWWFANRFFFWSGTILLGTFLLFFTIDVIGLPEGQAQRFLGTISLVLGGAILLIAIPAGRLADRIGRKPLVIAAGLMAAAGTAILLVVRHLSFLILGGGLVGLAMGVFLSANFALITDIVPLNEAARYMGIASVASSGGGAIARLLGGLIIDPINALLDSRSAGYLTLYSIALVFFLLSALSLIPLPVTPRKPQAKLEGKF